MARVTLPSGRVVSIDAHPAETDEDFLGPRPPEVGWPSIGTVSLADARAFARAILAACDSVEVKPEPVEVGDDLPATCEECDEETHPFTDPNTGIDGVSCDSCGWSWDGRA